MKAKAKYEKEKILAPGELSIDLRLTHKLRDSLSAQMSHQIQENFNRFKFIIFFKNCCMKKEIVEAA